MTEPLTGARRPLDTDPPLGGTQVTRAINDLAPYTVPRFTSTSQRDAAYSAFVVGGGVMQDGMRCAVGSTQYARDGGTWKVMWTPPTTGGVVAGDVPFTAFTSVNGWTARSTTTSGYEVVNRWAAVNLNFGRTSWNADQLITTLPLGARTARTRYFLGQWNGGVQTEIKFEPDGRIIATNDGTSGIILTVSYPVA